MAPPARATTAEEVDLACEYRDEHPAIATELEHLKGEIARVDEERRGNEKSLFEKLDALAQRLSNLEGRIVGYLLVGSVLTAVLVFIAERVFVKGG